MQRNGMNSAQSACKHVPTMMSRQPAGLKRRMQACCVACKFQKLVENRVSMYRIVEAGSGTSSKGNHVPG
jgi:hypothetical protein